MQIHTAMCFQRPDEGDKCTQYPQLLLAATEEQLAAKLSDHLKEWDADEDAPIPLDSKTVQPFIDYVNNHACYWCIEYEVQEVVA